MDEVITQLGLLLTQTRFARRALEDIERATAQYGSYPFTAALGTSGAAFGSPPLLDGALRVVNIGDLAPASGFGDTVAGLLGGVGSFIGNLFGGAVGGTLGSMKLVAAIPTINTLAGRIERIIDKLGLGQGQAASATPAGATVTPGAAAAATPPAAGGQSEFLAQLSSLRGKFDAVTSLLQAANGPGSPGGATAVTPPVVAAPDAERWRAWVDSLTMALEAATRLVGGLIVAVPTAIAALSWLFDRLPDFRNAITDTLRFVVRNVLLLRGAVIVLALETIAMIARVAAMAVRTLAATVNDALAALFAALAKLLDGALQLGAVLGKAITDTVNQLLNWLVPTVDKILRNLGELRVFRLIARLIDVLPALLALGGNKTAKAAGTAENPAVEGRPPLPAPAPPDLAAIMNQVSADAKAVTDKITDASRQLVDKPTTALREGLTTFAQQLDEAAIKEAELSDTNLAKRLDTLGTRATESAKMLLPVEPAHAETAFHPIAAAYGQWLATGGLAQLLDSMTTYFTTPPSHPEATTRSRDAESVPVVQIDEVVIDIAAAKPLDASPDSVPNMWGPGDFPLSRPDDELDRITGQQRLDEIRGSRLQRRRHVPVFG
jgi:hypothetical protein